MNEIRNHLSKFQEIKTFDPRVKVENDIVHITPFYFNFPFYCNFIYIFISTYILIKQNDPMINLANYILIGSFITFIITALKYYNTIYINLKEKIIIIKPNIILQFLIKRETIKFENIKTTTAVSNIDSTGFWGINRRYYITLILNGAEEIKLIGSNKKETASNIAETISTIL